MTRLKQILIPVAVVATGILGAFATQMSAKSSQVPLAMEVGWIDNEKPCRVMYLCQDSGPYVCTVTLGGIDHIVRGKINPNDATCPKTLFQLTPP